MAEMWHADKENKPWYFPPRLRQVINCIIHEPLTLILAGSGFGKTTAVADRLERCPRSTSYRWYTCFGEPPERSWAGICRLIAFACARTGERLGKLELPSVDHLGYIASLMEEADCESETVLVVDNYQLAGFPAPYRLLDALAAHNCPRLHIVVLSHPLYTDAALFPAHPGIRQISQDTFYFSPADVQKLFKQHQATLSREDAQKLVELTGGWVAALRLHLAGFLAGNSLMKSGGLSDLLEQAFWRRLTEREQGLFMGLGLLDSFTEAQAARMLGREVIDKPLWAALRRNAFVREEEGRCILHNLIKEFLSVKLQTIPLSSQRRLWQRAGTACQLQGKNVEALLFYAKAGDDAAALTLPLTDVERSELVRTKTEVFNALLSRCRVEVLEGRWLLLLDTAVKAGLNGKVMLARTAAARLMELRDEENGCETQRRTAGAALELLASFRAYNDFEAMIRHHAAAVALLPDPRDFYLPNGSWTFCASSVIYMFWRQSGKLAQTLVRLREGIPNYALLSGGKGLGGPDMAAAEALLLAGEEKPSATAVYQALTIARNNAQDSIVFCGYTLLARLAMLRGDGAGFRAAVSEIERLAYSGQEYLCLIASETALGFVYSLLELENEIPVWLLTEDAVRQSLYPVSVPFALIITLRHQGKLAPEELIGTAQAYIGESAAMHHFLPQLYYMLTQAAFYERNGQRRQALEKLNQILALALPDKAYLPVAEYYQALAPVLNDPALSCADDAALERIRSLGRRFVTGSATVRAALSGVSPLTPREREMALLASSRLTTQEIAQKLSVSPATVKNTLNKVYAKLGIKGKAELANKQL